MRSEWNEDQKKAVRDVIRWLTVRHKEDEKQKTPSYADALGVIYSMEVDIDHSSLLGRIIAGKPVLDKAPPRAYSYPWYELGEGERCAIGKNEINFYSEFLADVFPDRERPIGICQNPLWDQVGEWDETGGMLQYSPTGDLYRYDIDPYYEKTERDGGTFSVIDRAGWLQLKKVAGEDAPTKSIR